MQRICQLRQTRWLTTSFALVVMVLSLAPLQALVLCTSDAHAHIELGEGIRHLSHEADHRAHADHDAHTEHGHDHSDCVHDGSQLVDHEHGCVDSALPLSFVVSTHHLNVPSQEPVGTLVWPAPRAPAHQRILSSQPPCPPWQSRSHTIVIVV